MMPFSPVLLGHVCAGTLGLFSGAAAILFRKGSRRHAIAGRIFVFSMLAMATGAVYLAVQKHQPNNIGGGIFTFYLITTAWLTARRPDAKPSKFDQAAVLIPLVLGILTWISGFERLRSPTPPPDGVPAGMALFMGSVMLLTAAGDVRLFVRGSLLGKKRIARHLWRMCFALFIAAGSFFLGPNKRPLRLLSTVGLHQPLFRVILRDEVLLFLSIAPLLLLIFWLVRVRFTNTFKSMSLQRKGEAYSVPT